jgi:exodeoxyribonuclease VII large subunit
MQPFLKEQSLPNTYSVKELAGAIKRQLEAGFQSVRLKGEVSGVTYHKSGHVYFSLKEGDAVIDCIAWKGLAKTFNTPLSDGLAIIGTGSVTTYMGRSKYQFIMEGFELEGLGALYILLEERKKKLEAEGLFDAGRKKNLPRLPKRIGLITSSEGSVLHDIIARLEERYVENCVYLWPVTVQGENTPRDVIRAIEGFHRFENRPDVLLIARGGGSFEDLWFFNDEALVRAIRASDIPVITAIGHEPDTPLIDYASDKRASTPTNAAEIVAPKKQDVCDYMDRLDQRMKNILQKQSQMAFSGVQRYSNIGQMALLYLAPKCGRLDNIHLMHYLEKCYGLKYASWQNFSSRCAAPNQVLESKKVQVAHASDRLLKALEKNTSFYKNQLDSLWVRLENSNFNKLLQRGFSILMSDQKLLTSCEQLSQQTEISIRFVDGVVKGDFSPK